MIRTKVMLAVLIGALFAFGGNALIATSFYVVQRTCRTRLAGGMWRLGCISAIVTAFSLYFTAVGLTAGAICRKRSDREAREGY